jgi:hypothetical protein
MQTHEVGHGLNRSVIAQILKFLTSPNSGPGTTEEAREIVKTMVIKNLLVEDIFVPVIRAAATSCNDHNQFRRFIRTCSHHLYSYRVGHRKNVHLESLLMALLRIMQHTITSNKKNTKVIVKEEKENVADVEDDDSWAWT